jgi:hypothetical protein
MAQITKLAAVANATAIWEYDPEREDNRVLEGSLDVIAAIRTLAIKVSKSHLEFYIVLTTKYVRYKPLGNALRISRAVNFVAAFLIP